MNTDNFFLSFVLFRHVPREFYYSRKDPSKRVLEYTDFDYGKDQLRFSFAEFIDDAYVRAVEYIGCKTPFQTGQQKNCMSE